MLLPILPLAFRRPTRHYVVALSIADLESCLMRKFRPNKYYKLPICRCTIRAKNWVPAVIDVCGEAI